MSGARTPKSVFDDIRNWKRMSPREILENMKAIADKGDAPGYVRPGPLQFDVSEDITMADMYCYLFHRFGEPNGFQMALKSPNTSDNLIHWSYELLSGTNRIHINGLFFHFSVLVFDVETAESKSKSYFVEQMRTEIHEAAADIAVVKNTLEEWFVFQNPYFQYSDLVGELVDEMRESLPLESFGSRPGSAELVREKTSQNSRKFSKIFRGRMTLKLLIPIWIESFINLILFACATAETRSDLKTHEKLLRSKWLFKVQNFHPTCYGFSSPITGAEPEIQNIKALFRERNRILHGGFSPELVGRKIYYAQKFIPLMAEHGYLTDFLHQLNLYGLDQFQLENEIKQAEIFFELILSKMEPRFLEQIVRMMNDPLPGWDKKRNIPGSILPTTFVDGWIRR